MRGNLTAVAIFLFVLLFFRSMVVFAAEGRVVYAQNNCYILETDQGYTLFERSGGAFPQEEEALTGEMHDFGYQELHTSGTGQSFVGWIENYGVTADAEVETYLQNCR